MPRLVGKRSNRGFFWSLAIVLIAIAGFGALEYKGYTNLLPEVGPEQPLAGDASDR
jgi:hypothetical protein